MSIPTVGVLPALSDAFEDREEELSARARGAVGGGLALDGLGGGNGRTCVQGFREEVIKTRRTNMFHCWYTQSLV